MTTNILRRATIPEVAAAIRDSYGYGEEIRADLFERMATDLMGLLDIRVVNGGPNTQTTSDTEELTDAEWRAFQSIPDQGYSHRHWVNCAIKSRLDVARADSATEITRLRMALTEAQKR